MTKSGRVLSGKPVVFSIPIDFCIEFWNSTFSPVLEFTEGIFLTASARAFQWCKPRMRSCFRSKVIQVFLAANSTWTYYSCSVFMHSSIFRTSSNIVEHGGKGVSNQQILFKEKNT